MPDWCSISPHCSYGSKDEENLPPHIWRGVMRLWLCNPTLSQLAFKPISLRLCITRWSIMNIYLDMCSASISQTWLQVDRNMMSDGSARRNYSTVTDSTLTKSNITQCWSMNEGLLPDAMLPSAGWYPPQPSWCDFSWCTWMAIDKHSQLHHVHLGSVHGAPPPDDTPDEESVDPQKPDLTCTPDRTKTKAHRQVVAVENTGGRAYAKATGLYNKDCKLSEQWNP